MAKVLRKHRYHGLRGLTFKLTPLAIWVSRLPLPLAGIFVLLSWRQNSAYLLVFALLTAVGALFWLKYSQTLLRQHQIMTSGHGLELIVGKILARLPREWLVLNDLALKTQGPVTQIDHLVLTPAVIWVLETKSQRGRIVSSPDGPWQVHKNGLSREIVNPVKQNRVQVKAIQRFLDHKQIKLPCHGLVIMDNDSVTHPQLIQPNQVITTLITRTAAAKGQLSAKQLVKLAHSIREHHSKRAPLWRQRQHPGLLFVLLAVMPAVLWLLLFILTN